MAAYARGSSAVSTEARALKAAAVTIVESAERSQALFGKKAAAISQLREVVAESAAEGSEAIDPQALLRAEQCVRALPDGVPMPEFAAEPDGALSLDWIRSRNRLFSLSVGGSHRLAYAWLDGADKGHGVASFDGGNIPPRVLQGIRGIMNDENATFRAA